MGGDRIPPIGEQSLAYVGERFGRRQLAQGHRGVAGIAARMCGVIVVDGRWRRLVGATPAAERLVAELGTDRRTASALKCAVVTFVQTPTSAHRLRRRSRLGKNSGPIVGAAVAQSVSIPVLGGFGGGPWLDGRVRMATAAIGYSADALDNPPDSYANVARIAYDAITAYAEDVRSSRQIAGGIRG